MTEVSRSWVPANWAGRLPMPRERIDHLVLAGFLISTAGTFGSSVAAAIFLSTHGGEGIAIFYILYALVSIPAWIIYSRFIDSGSRVVLMQRFLVVAAIAITLLVCTSGIGGTAAEYGLYTGISLLEMLGYSIFQVVLTDYLTAREMTRHATKIAVAMSAGGMVGGAMAGTLAVFAQPFWLLFGMPILLLVCLAHLRWLAAHWKPAGEWQAETEVSILESLRSIGRILRGFLIAALLSAAIFLNISTQCISEYMVFTIYSNSFTDGQSLATFLGFMNGALNFVGLAIGLWLVDPLMQRLGVARMNLLFPAACGISLAGMMAAPILPMAMLGHIVYDGLSNNIDTPVTAINYNAIPSRFVGRLRVFNDGLIYPFALAVSGTLIWVVDAIGGYFAVGLLGMALSLCFLASGWGIGWRYFRGLVGILREGTIDLEQPGQFARQAVAMADSKKAELAAMLEGEDKAAAQLALRIISHASIEPHAAVIARLLAGPGNETVVALARGGDQHAPALLKLWHTADPAVRLRIAQYLAAVGKPLPADRGPSKVMDALDLAARIDRSPELLPTLTEMARSRLDIALALFPVAEARADNRLVPMLAGMISGHPSLEPKLVEIIGTKSLARTGAVDLPEELVQRAIEARDPKSRAIGYRQAALAGWPSEKIAAGLADPDADVRRVAIAALSGRPDTVPAAEPLIDSENPDTRLAAIEVLGQAGATELLFGYLYRKAFPQIALYLDWQAALRGEESAWAEIARIAISEANAATIAEVLATLEAIGHKQTVKYIRRFLSARDERMRGRAAEAISAVDQRRLVAPLMPLLDGRGNREENGVADRALIAALVGSDLPWLRRAAAAAVETEDGMRNGELDLLDRLVFLRRVQLFESCSLDDLYAIDKSMTRVDYLDGETIIQKGDQGEDLFILLDGEVKVGAAGPGGFVEFTRLHPGAMFGEMALFGDGERSADIIAVGKVACLVLDRKHFEDLALQRPDILMQICRVFGARLRAANSRFEETSRRD